MSTRFRTVSLITLLVAVFGTAALAVPPSPEAKAKFIQEGTWAQKMANLRAMEAAQPPNMLEEALIQHLGRYRTKMATSTDAVDTVRLCVLLIEFPDFRHNSATYPIPASAGGGTLNCNLSATSQMFDSLLFSQQVEDAVFNPTGSMTEYYLEVSYGNYFIQGDVFGWFTAPNTYSDYVRTDDGGSQSPRLVRDAVLAADGAGVNFLPYGNGGSSVPGIIIIHAGPGAEEGAYGIWSHRYNMSTAVTTDGVTLSGYTIQPEEAFGRAEIAGVGVFCHEYGHVLGLPDYYDVGNNPGSEGLGAWSLMASGNWNGSGRLPAHFDAHSKLQIGFNTVQIVLENAGQVAIPAAATSPICYLLQPNPGGSNPDMWWVENRHRTGFDAGLPGSGLIIYHMDAGGSQTNPDRYYIAVEECDNNNSLNYGGNRGQAGDAWGTTINRNFHDYSQPSSRTYDGALTEISVLNISDPGPIMYADLGIAYAIPWVLLVEDSLTITDAVPGGNGDGEFLPGETISIWLEVRNVMAISYKPTLHLDVDNPTLQIPQNNQAMGFSLNPTLNNENFNPIQVRIPDDFSSSLVTLTLTVISDSTSTSDDNSFQTSFEFTYQLGRTGILLVDDDNGYGDESNYTDALDRLRLPYARWDKLAQGSPDYSSLSQYPYVLWMTGSYYPDVVPPISGGTLTVEDVAYLKQVLDAGGCLLLGSPSAPTQLQTLDPAFLSNYLHAEVTGSGSREYFRGATDNVVGGGLIYTTRSGVIWNIVSPIISPVQGGVTAFTLTRPSGGNFGSCGVTYDGAYRTVLLSFGVDYLAHDRTADGFAPRDTLITRALRFFARGAATPVEEDPTELLPTRFALEQNYPNPFNPTTTISYHIDAGAPQRTTLAVFNVLGQKVATLVDRVQPAGEYTVTWQGSDEQGNEVATGVYFYRLTHGNDVESRKMLLLK